MTTTAIVGTADDWPGNIALGISAGTTPSTTIAPYLRGKIDWGNDAAFTEPLDVLDTRILTCTWTRGRSGDNSSEAKSGAMLQLDNYDDRFTPDRNWFDNPSLEVSTVGWDAEDINAYSLVNGAAFARITTDAAPSAGSSCLEITFSAVTDQTVAYAIPYTFRSGATYSLTFYVKQATGTGNVQWMLGSRNTNDRALATNQAITGSWVQKTLTWTPTADRTDVIFGFMSYGAITSTVRLDALQVNPGSTANAYLEAPTKGMLIPGRPVLIYGVYDGDAKPQFSGWTQRISVNAADWTVSITCYDTLANMSEETAVVRYPGTARTAREYRRELLAAYARGSRNLCFNPSLETDTVGWATAGTCTLARITTDHAPDAGGSACLEVTANDTQTVNYVVRSLPRFYSGETYRVAFYAKWVSGPTDYTVYFGGTGTIPTKRITLTAQWQRFTMTATVGADWYAAVTGAFFGLAAQYGTGGVYRLDGVQITRGPALFKYADTGSGRWPNYVGSPEFDALLATGWGEGWHNLCSNGSFETSLSGWFADAASPFISNAPTTWTRDLGSSLPAPNPFGSYCASFTGLASGTGVYMPLAGTFSGLLSYTVSGYIYKTDGTAGTQSVKIGIGSSGTPADFAEATGTVDLVWRRFSVTWAPSADRSDVHLYIKQNSASTKLYSIDGVLVTRGGSLQKYADTGPLGGIMDFPTSLGPSSSAPYSGSGSLAVVCQPTVGSGSVYTFGMLEAAFQQGVTYAVSLWARVASGAGMFRIGIAANNDAGAFDETYTDVALGLEYRNVTLTWTPTGDRKANDGNAADIILGIAALDTQGLTAYVDGVMVNPGSTAQALELPEWGLSRGEDTDVFERNQAVFQGPILSSLARINSAVLSRHWIRALMTAPYWQYATSDRNTSRAIVEAFVEDIEDVQSYDIDRDSVVNSVAVTSYDPVGAANLVTYYAKDTADLFGSQPGTSIDISDLTAATTIGDAVGPAIVNRYGRGVARPTMIVTNRWPSQLERDLDDTISLTFARSRLVAVPFSILSVSTTVSQSGQRWQTTYRLEEIT